MIAFLIWNTQMMACFCESTRDMSVLASLHSLLLPLNLVYQSTLRRPKFLVTDYGIVPGDCDNIVVRGLVVKHVSFIGYLVSVLTPNTRSSADIGRRLAQASYAFDYLREVLVDDKSALATRRQLYSACVPSVLLYISECWTTLCSDLRHLGAFRHQPLGTILKISTRLQKCICLTSTLLRSRFRDEKRVAEKVRSRQLVTINDI